LPKARDTARLAEKVTSTCLFAQSKANSTNQIITLGKKGDRLAYSRAAAFLLKPALLPKLFVTFTERYANRPGGYTRIHKFGNRPGDNAPHAILELVDNPRDLRWEITSRAIGWEMLRDKLKSQRPVSIINRGAEGTQELVETERSLGYRSSGGLLRPKTRWNLQKVLRFRDQNAPLELSQKAGDYMVSFVLFTHTWAKERIPRTTY
jgi:large subunit ribosomal protein L17